MVALFVLIWLLIGFYLGTILIKTHREHQWVPFFYDHKFSATEEASIIIASLPLWPLIWSVLLLLVFGILAIKLAFFLTDGPTKKKQSVKRPKIKVEKMKGGEFDGWLEVK